tara:strand:- start:123337 stop:123582 length:246 start_codon:yes stop_codon:yes gene_type:complete
MNMNERLERALAKLDTMSEEDFLNDLIRFGYEPKLETTNFLTVNPSLEHHLAYTTKFSIMTSTFDSFSQCPANDCNFSLAA